MTHPTLAQLSTLVDRTGRGLTPEETDRLRAGIHRLRAEADRLAAERDMLGRETDRLRTDWVEIRNRAERAEAEVAENAGVIQALRRHRDTAETGRDTWATEAAAQTLRAEKAEAERDAAQDALDRVRAELAALNSETAGLNPYAMAGRRDAVARIRATLDPQQTQETT